MTEKIMTQKICPFLLAGFTAHYGAWDSSGNWMTYCKCADDCALYSKGDCSLKVATKALITFRRNSNGKND